MPPLSAARLAAAVDRLLDADGVPPGERTTVVVAGERPIARLGLALDERDLDRLTPAALDAVLLHRHWRAPLDRLPSGVAVLACHLPLDRRLGLASTPELHAALLVRELATIGERDGRPLAAVCAPLAPTSLDALRARLRATFGAVEAELPAGRDADPVARVATARAMTPALVREARAAGATAYVTGELRAPALDAAREAGMHVLAVGHRRSERWALGALGAMLRAWRPALAVEVADDGGAP